jgi:hypothetical protein
VTTGITAALALGATGGTASPAPVNFTGVTASPSAAEVDLAIDAGGDLLTIDPAGNALMVSAAITFTGGTASLVVPEFSNTLETEAWVGLATEDGRGIVTEGS